MAIEQVNVCAELQQGVAVKVQARQFELMLDEPKSLGGTDTGMNPVEALLGALGACQAIVARVYAAKFNVVLDGFNVKLEGDLDLDGFLGKSEVRPGYSAIRYQYWIESPSAQEDVAALIKFVAEKCPVGDSLAQGVELSLNGVHLNQQVL